MKRGSVIKSSSLSCVLPLAAPTSLSSVERRSRRLLRTPTPPFVFCTPESLASVGAVPPSISLAAQAGVFTGSGLFPACMVFRPDVYFGRPNCLPRAIRAAVVWDNQSLVPASAAIYLASYEAEGLADKGVHLYVYSSLRDATNPLTAMAPLESQTDVTVMITAPPLSGAVQGMELNYSPYDLSGVPGGSVYAAYVGGGAYGFGVQGIFSSGAAGDIDPSGFALAGYAIEWGGFRATGDPTPIPTISVTGWAEYAAGSYAVPGGTTYNKVFLSTAKSAADAAVLAQVAARCEDFQHTFWTLAGGTDGSGNPVFGDPAGAIAAMGIGSVTSRRTLAGSSGVRDVATSIAEIVADIADFFA